MCSQGSKQRFMLSAQSSVIGLSLSPEPILMAVHGMQVELASLDYKASRLVRSLDAASGQRGGFGEGGLTEVVSARCILMP